MAIQPAFLPSELARESPSEDAQLSADLNIKELQLESRHPPNNDPIIGSLTKNLLDRVQSRTFLGNVIRGISIDHGVGQPGGASPSESIGRIRAAISSDLLTYSSDVYPYDGFDNPDRFTEPLQEIEDLARYGSPQDPRVEELTTHLIIERVSTSIAERYALVELIMQTLRHRFDEDVQWLDIACGLMHGAHQIVRKDELPFTPLKVVQKMDRRGEGYSNVVDTDIMRAANNLLLDTPSTPSGVVCTDRQKIYHNNRGVYGYDILQYARASLRPQVELMNPTFMAHYEELHREKSPLVDFFRADMTEPADLAAFENRFGGRKYHFISLIMVMQQLKEHEQLQVMEWSKKHLAPGGVIIRAGFEWGHGEKIKDVKQYQHWHQAGRYTVHLYDSLRPDRYSEIFRAENSRISSVAPGSGDILIAKDRIVSVPEALMMAASPRF
jgi:hypothetical protein